MLRILMLNHNVRGRGTYFRCMAYARQLVKRGHLLDVMTISPTSRVRFSESTTDGIKVIEAPDLSFGVARSGWDPWDTLMRMVRLRRAPYDLVHGFDGRPVVRYPARMLQFLGVPYVSDWADWWGRGGVTAERSGWFLRQAMSPIETYFEESCRPLADHVTTISSALARRAQSLGLPADRVTRIPGGTEPDRIRPLDQTGARRELGLAGDWRIIAYAGFVQYDVDFLIEAFANVGTSRVKLLLIGPRVDARLERLPGWVRANVIQTGVLAQDEVFKYLAASDLLLLPFLPKIANLGRWPNKLSEYMCLAKPIVTHAVGDVTTVVDVGAAFAAPLEPEGFASATVQLLDDAPRRDRLSVAARSAAETVFNYERLAQTLENLYRALACER